MQVLFSVVSVIALIVSIATYYFNLRLINQNKIFDEKIKAYGKVATAIDNAILAFSEGISTVKYLRDEKPKGYEEEIDNLADDIDAATNEMFNVLMANIMLFPKNVYNELDELATFIESIENHNVFESSEKMSSLFEELRRKQIVAIKLMRNDLHSDQLNIRLHKRLGRNSIGHKIFGTS